MRYFRHPRGSGSLMAWCKELSLHNIISYLKKANVLASQLVVGHHDPLAQPLQNFDWPDSEQVLSMESLALWVLLLNGTEITF